MREMIMALAWCKMGYGGTWIGYLGILGHLSGMVFTVKIVLMDNTLRCVCSVLVHLGVSNLFSSIYTSSTSS